jgi:hypothetical protein
MNWLQPIYQNIPEELRSLPQWVVWKAVKRDGKWTKVPCDPKTGKHAKSDDPATWAPFFDAYDAYAQSGKYAGIGFVLSTDDPFCGWDLDHCLEPGGAVESWAIEIVTSLESYTEVSPSGTGLRAIVKAQLPPYGRKKGNIEVYESGRFLTITGQHFYPSGGQVKPIALRQGAVDALHPKIFGNGHKPGSEQRRASGPPQDDAEILEKAFSSKNGERIRALYNGDASAYNSQSEADSALCYYLAFWLDRDAARIDAVFRQSGLMRDKWDKRHYSNGKTYGQGTIEDAIAGTSETYRGRTDQNSGQQSAGIDPNDPPDPLPDELLPVEPFDYDLLPDAIRPWAEDICDRVQCPPDFVAVGIMAAMGSLIGRKVAIRPQARTDWTVVPNQWALVVGRPGVLKSPALEAALAPLKRLIASAQERYQEEEKNYKAEAQAAKIKKESTEKQARKALEKDPGADILALLAVDEPDAPVLKRYVANDTSPASLGELLRQNPNGLLVFRDEIVSLLKGLDKEGQEEGRGFYLTGWNGDSPYTFDRIGRGLNLHIPAVCISLLGGTQPGRLAEYIKHAVKGGAADDGLIQRFGLLVWPDTNGKWKDVDRWPDSQAKNQAFKVFDMLDRLDPLEIGAEQDTDHDGEAEGPPFLRFHPAALEIFQEWRINLERRLRGELHPALESHFAKYRKLIPSLALVIHLADGGSGPVSRQATLKALSWGEYLETHAQRAYGSVSQPEIAVAKAILGRIKKGDLPEAFSSREVWRPGWAKLSDRDQVVEALELLGDYGWLSQEEVKTGGRPKTVYHVHPEVFS